MRSTIAPFVFSLFALFATLASGCSAEVTGDEDDTSQAAFGRRTPEAKNKFLQVRWLEMGWVGRHADVCVDDTCYTSGPGDGFYKRDRTGSATLHRAAFAHLESFHAPPTPIDAHVILLEGPLNLARLTGIRSMRKP